MSPFPTFNPFDFLRTFEDSFVTLFFAIEILFLNSMVAGFNF